MNRNERWEELFSQSTEDVSTYLWAARALSRPPEGYAPDYLLVLALCSRSRARAALSRTAGAPGGEYSPYCERLNALWTRAEDALSRAAARPEADLAGLSERLAALGGNFRRVRERVNDKTLFGVSDDETDRELRDLVHGFVMGFTAVSLALEELSRPPFTGLDLAGLTLRFKELESEFRDQAGCLAAVSDLLPVLVEREYGRTAWWLAEPREPAPFPAEVALSPFAPYADELRQEGAEAPRDCPQAARVVALALGELSASAAAEAREHVVVCHGCRRLFLDVMGISGETPHDPPPDVWAEACREGARPPGGREAGAASPKPPRALRFSSARWPFAAMLLLVSALVVLSLLMGRPLLPLGRTAKPAPASAPADAPAVTLPPETVFEQGPRKVALKITGRVKKGAAMGGLITGYTEFDLAPGGALHSGDGFRISVVVNKPSHLYVIFRGSAGDVRPLMRGAFQPDRAVTLPGRKGWFFMDSNTGTETVWILASAREIAGFDKKLSGLSGDVNLGTVFPEAQAFSFSFRHEP